MKVLLIKANQKLYASEGKLNNALCMKSKDIFEEAHEVEISDIADGKWDIEKEVRKLKEADLIIYHFPMWWFGVPNNLKKYLDEVLLYEETFVITDIYGEGGQLINKKFKIVVTSNMKKSDLGTAPILKKYHMVDELLTQLIITNNYLGIREQLPTFHADNVIKGDTSNILQDYEVHLQLALI